MGTEGAVSVEDGSSGSAGGSGKVQENRLLLQNLTAYIVKENRYSEIPSDEYYDINFTPVVMCSEKAKWFGIFGI